MPPRRVASAPDSGVSPADDVLDSWKQIAGYLRRDVRTVIRWEATRGMPVHRLPGGARRAVYARKSELEAWRAEAQDPAESAVAAPRPSVAVLPFLNLTPDRDNEYFADGLADEILTLLANVPGLRVTARTSSFAFRGREEDAREIGKRLGVSAVLEGTLRKAGDRIRVTVQLISTRDGYHLWAEQYDRSADDVFAIQDEIAEGVVKNLKVRLQGRAVALPARHHLPPREAFHLYLKGKHFFTLRGAGKMQRAIECFEKAVSIDPDYAAAHLGVADVFAALGLWGMLPPASAFARVKAAASRALAIDKSLAAAHVVLGSALLLADWDWGRARGHFERAEAHLAPPTGPFSIGFYYILAGRSADAFRYFQDVFEKDPLSSIAADAGGNRAHRAAGVRCRDDAAGRSARPRRPAPDDAGVARVLPGSAGTAERSADAAQQRRRARHRDGASAPGERPGPGLRG